MKSLERKCVPKFSLKTLLGKVVWSVPINISIYYAVFNYLLYPLG